MGFLTSLRAKLELTQLERRYTRRRESRTTFRSGAQYRDGEYVYPSSPAVSNPSQSTYSAPSPTPLPEDHAFSSWPSNMGSGSAVRSGEKCARHDGANGRGGEQGGEFSALWAKSMARMPSVRVVEAFGGGGRVTRVSRGDRREAPGGREGGVRGVVEERRKEGDGEDLGGFGQW